MKDVVSINPLDVAGDESSDEDALPIWMRPKAKNSGRRQSGQGNQRNHRSNQSEARTRHNSANAPASSRPRRGSARDRSRERQPPTQQQQPTNGGGDYQRKHRNRDNRPKTNYRGGKKPGSTASRSWQHDDRTRTAY